MLSGPPWAPSPTRMLSATPGRFPPNGGVCARTAPLQCSKGQPAWLVRYSGGSLRTHRQVAIWDAWPEPATVPGPDPRLHQRISRSAFSWLSSRREHVQPRETSSFRTTGSTPVLSRRTSVPCAATRTPMSATQYANAPASKVCVPAFRWPRRPTSRTNWPNDSPRKESLYPTSPTPPCGNGPFQGGLVTFCGAYHRLTCGSGHVPMPGAWPRK